MHSQLWFSSVELYLVIVSGQFRIQHLLIDIRTIKKTIFFLSNSLDLYAGYQDNNSDIRIIEVNVSVSMFVLKRILNEETRQSKQYRVIFSSKFSMNNIMITTSGFSLRNNYLNAFEGIHCFCFLNRNMELNSSSGDWLFATTCQASNQILGVSRSIPI